MSCAARIPITICQGASFRKVYRWGQSQLTYRPITGATRAAPCVLTVPTHGVPDGWPIRVESVRGMEQLNREEPYVATVTGADTIELNAVNALDFDAYGGGGTIVYSTPVDMAGFTARAQIRASQQAAQPILSLTTENGGIVVDNAAKTITLVMTPAQTEALDFTAAVYDLELEAGTGDVSRIAFGAVTLSPEVTR
jgi:hypothetical protein